MLIADFYTKPLQGQLFRLFRSLILNLDDKVALSMSAKEKNLIIPGRTETISRRVQQECVKENVGINTNAQRTYADVCKGTYNYDVNNTRNIVASKDAGLLIKLRNVAKQCFGKGSNIPHVFFLPTLPHIWGTSTSCKIYCVSNVKLLNG